MKTLREITEKQPKICAGGAVPAWGSLGDISTGSVPPPPGHPLGSAVKSNYSLNKPHREKLHCRIPLAVRVLTCAMPYVGLCSSHHRILNLRPLTGMNSRHLFLNIYIKKIIPIQHLFWAEILGENCLSSRRDDPGLLLGS